MYVGRRKERTMAMDEEGVEDGERERREKKKRRGEEEEGRGGGREEGWGTLPALP